MVICYYKDINLTKNFVRSKIKKWIKKLDDRQLSRLCDCINEIDIEITNRQNLATYFVGPRLNIMQAQNHYTGIEGMGDFFGN